MILIEVQTVIHLSGEDDITRHDDVYARRRGALGLITPSGRSPSP